jgi:hypothetical protein
MTNVKRYISFLMLQIRLNKNFLGCVFATLTVSQLGIIIWKLLSVKNQGNASDKLNGIPYFYYEILEQSRIELIFFIVMVGAYVLYGLRKIDQELYHVPIPFFIQAVLQFIFSSVIIGSVWLYELFILLIGAKFYQLILPKSMLEPNIIANTFVQSSFFKRVYPFTNEPRMICVLCTLMVIVTIMTYVWGLSMLCRKDFFFNMCITILILVPSMMKDYSVKPEYIAWCSFALTLVFFMYCCISLWYHGRKEKRRPSC